MAVKENHMSDLKTILVVDDEPSTRMFVRATLETESYDVLEANNGLEGLTLARMERPDLVLLDVSMPAMDGLQVCEILRQDQGLAQVPILILTGKTQTGDTQRGFEAGADDYIRKPVHPTELLARVQAVLRRVDFRNSPRSLTPHAPITLHPQQWTVEIENRRVLLTPTEYHLFNHLLDHAGQLVSADQLLQEVWDYPPGAGDPNLVRAHIRNLRSKIELNPQNPRHIRTVPRRGYTLSL